MNNKNIYERYKNGFEGLPITMNPYDPECMEPNFWLSCMIIDEECDVDPISVIKKLAEEKIDSRPIWKPMHMQPIFRDNDFITAGGKSVGEDVFGRGLCLPSDIKMTAEEQERVISVIKSCFEG